jgi:mannose-6-phosphate isomerase-like protein (cupin superfamily)
MDVQTATGEDEMMNQQQVQAYLLGQEQGRALWHLDALLVFKALGAETDGRFWALEGLADRRMAVPLHAHSREDEIWYILEGEMRFDLGGEAQVLGPGGFVYIPRHVPHTFQVLSETARWFGIGTPAGLDQWFFETGTPAQSLRLPPPSTTEPDVEAIVTSLRAYGTETLGPPPAAL